MEALVKRRISLANSTCVKLQDPSRNLIGKRFRQKIKIFGNSGSPCLMPWEGEKYSPFTPFYMIEKVVDEIKFMIKVTAKVGK